MNLKHITAVRIGSFLVTLGAGFCWLNPLPPRLTILPVAVEFPVPAEPVRPLVTEHASPPVEGAALMEVAGFDAAAAMKHLRATLTDLVYRKPPGLSLIATPETWVATGRFSQPELEALILASLGVADAGEKNSYIAVLFEQLAMMNPARALELVGRLPSSSTSATVAGMLQFWGAHDAAAVRQWGDGLLAKRAAGFPEVSKVLEGLAARDLHALPVTEGLNEALTAYRNAKGLRKPGHFSSRDAGPVLAWARRSHQWQSALDAADDPPLRILLHGEWAAADPVAWLAWMRSHPGEGKAPEAGRGRLMERREILGQALSRILQQSGTSMSSYSLGPQLDGVVALLAEEGSNFSDEFGSASVFMNRGFPTWLEAQPAEASGWVKRHQSEAWIQPVIELVATHVAKDDPLAALAWAAQIKDEGRRRQTFIQVHGIWRALDPGAAESWAAQHAAALGR